MATAKLLGASIKRREDPRFITGKGNYTDDLKLAGHDLRGLREEPARQRPDPQRSTPRRPSRIRAWWPSSPART